MPQRCYNLTSHTVSRTHQERSGDADLLSTVICRLKLLQKINKLHVTIISTHLKQRDH